MWLGVFGNTKGGAWAASPFVAKDMIIEHLQEIGLQNDHYIATMTDAGGYTYDLNDTRSSKYSEKELTPKLNDPHDPVRFLLCINKGTAGLNVHRFGALFVARVKNKFFLCLDVGLVLIFETIVCVRLLSNCPLIASRAVSALIIPPLSWLVTMYASS